MKIFRLYSFLFTSDHVWCREVFFSFFWFCINFWIIYIYMERMGWIKSKVRLPKMLYDKVHMYNICFPQLWSNRHIAVHLSSLPVVNGRESLQRSSFPWPFSSFVSLPFFFPCCLFPHTWPKSARGSLGTTWLWSAAIYWTYTVWPGTAVGSVESWMCLSSPSQLGFYSSIWSSRAI